MFFVIPGSNKVDFGTPPENATVIDPKSSRPFAGRIVLAGALLALIRLNTEWYATRWDDAPKGCRADLTGANLTGADLTGANLTGAKGNEYTTLPAGWKVDESGLIVRSK